MGSLNPIARGLKDWRCLAESPFGGDAFLWTAGFTKLTENRDLVIWGNRLVKQGMKEK